MVQSDYSVSYLSEKERKRERELDNIKQRSQFDLLVQMNVIKVFYWELLLVSSPSVVSQINFQVQKFQKSPSAHHLCQQNWHKNIRKSSLLPWRAQHSRGRSLEVAHCVVAENKKQFEKIIEEGMGLNRHVKRWFKIR